MKVWVVAALLALAGCSCGASATWCDDVELVVRGVAVLTGAAPPTEGTYAELRAEMEAAAVRAREAPSDDAAAAASDVAEALITAAARIDRSDFDPADRARPTLAVLSAITRTGATLAGQYAVHCK